jgi:hypothetical protein
MSIMCVCGCGCGRRVGACVCACGVCVCSSSSSSSSSSCVYFCVINFSPSLIFFSLLHRKLSKYLLFFGVGVRLYMYYFHTGFLDLKTIF